MGWASTKRYNKVNIIIVGGDPYISLVAYVSYYFLCNKSTWEVVKSNLNYRSRSSVTKTKRRMKMNREFLGKLGLEKEVIDKIMKEHGKTIS